MLVFTLTILRSSYLFSQAIIVKKGGLAILINTN